MRRLPIYLLLDCSESMAGEAIEQISRGVDAMLAALRSDPMALESAYVSVITFATTARQVVPLTEVLTFQQPKLPIGTGTCMGAALRLVKQCIEREVVKTTATTKGDYKALVILFTDGEPTDAWEDAAAEFKQRQKQIANVYAIACGPDADTDVLRSITDIVLKMSDMSPAAWRKVFVWLSASVQSTSVALGSGREGQQMSLPPLPGDALEFAPESMGYKDPRPRQVFLHCCCSRDGKPYIMRFARRPNSDYYVALCSHRLDVVDNAPGALEDATSVHTSMLEGCPPCPYCENGAAVMCACGTLSCVAATPTAVHQCPKCKQQGMLGPDRGQGFDVKRAKG